MDYSLITMTMMISLPKTNSKAIIKSFKKGTHCCKNDKNDKNDIVEVPGKK